MNKKITSAFLFVFCFISYFSTTVSATTYTVYNTNDSDVLSLRERISSASPNDTITFAPLINGDTIMLTSQLIIDKPLVIIGNGIDSTIIDGSFNDNFRLLNITFSCKITGITFQNGGGDVSGTTNTNLWGGAIYFNNSGEVLTVNNCLFKENKAYLGGAIRIQEGGMEIISSSFKNNESFKFGGAINTRNTTTKFQSIDNSLFEANATGDGGGAIFQETGSELTIRNCTFVKNASNTTGGGVKRAGTSNLNILNTLFYNNTAPTGGPDLSASSIAFQLNNFLGDYSGSSLTSGSNGNITGNPSFIGGMTGDYRLRFDSPCVNAGNITLLTTHITEDLNGMARLQADTIDIGAYEFQEQLYVKADANGINNGGKWNNAFQDLQNALKTATKGTKIWVAKGTYKPATTADRTISFIIPDSVKVYGGFVGIEPDNYDIGLRDFIANETILSGDIGILGNDSDNSLHVVRSKDVTAFSEVNGFTIKHGNANIIGESVYSEANNTGGGWLNEAEFMDSKPSINNCFFEENSAYFGGAFANVCLANLEVSPSFSACRFLNNEAIEQGGAIANYTDGYYDGNSSAECSPTFEGCSFIQNNAKKGGAFYVSAIYGGACRSIFNKSYFEENVGSIAGGAIAAYGRFGDLAFETTNCIFNSNGSEHLNFEEGDISTSRKYTNCTFNGASSQTMSHFSYESTPKKTLFTNCIFWNNGGVIVSDTSHVNINYSIVEDVAFTQGPNSGKNNINSDPLFKNASAGDLSLKPCSPAVDAGTNAGTTALDILGEPRIFGCIKADMGAYEFQGLYKNSAFDLNTVSLDNAGIGSSSTYYGTPIVASDKILKPGVKTLYKAPNAIELNPGFKAEAVQAFETEIGVEACP